jgi:hypothetical protein
MGRRQKERAFLNWYQELLDRFGRDRALSYNQEVEIFRSPEDVRGYAELRDQKMAEARQRVEAICSASRGKAIA